MKATATLADLQGAGELHEQRSPRAAGCSARTTPTPCIMNNLDLRRRQFGEL